jgi:hypothetical protein
MAVDTGSGTWKEEEEREDHKTQLARAIARGESITAWAHQNGVPPRWGFLWSRDSKVRRAVEARATRRAKMDLVQE